MTERAAPPGEHRWELSKENVLPARRGRSTKTIALAAPSLPDVRWRWEDAQSIMEELTNVYSQQDDLHGVQEIKSHRAQLDGAMAWREDEVKNTIKCALRCAARLAAAGAGRNHSRSAHPRQQ